MIKNFSINPDDDFKAALETDALWTALKGATPEQLSKWVDNNATNLAGVRKILKILLLFVKSHELRLGKV